MEHRPLDDEARALRRRAARRRTRRRRWTALAALAGGLALVVAVVVATGSHEPPGLAAATTPAATGDEPADAGGPIGTRAPEPAPADSAPPGTPIPILMYHATEAAPADSGLPELWVPAETFAETMELLHARGYSAITMQNAYDYWEGRRRVPRNPVVLTFDDGFRSHVTSAMPTLKRLGWGGVLYLEVAALHTPGVGGIGRAGVRALLRAGWELGSHTLTHPDLTTLSADQLDSEVAGARTRIRREFRQPVDSFCYPAGKHDDTVVAAVERAGFETATTVEPGLAGPDDLLRLPRIRVNASDSPEAVLERIAALGAPPAV